jgi:hypothetical protein
MILVTGAGGSNGSERDGPQAASDGALHGVEFVDCGFRRSGECSARLRGVDRAFLLTNSTERDILHYNAGTVHD